MAALRCLIACLQAQTYAHWEALLTHDGPVRHSPDIDLLLSDLSRDKRLRWLETPEREGHFGHRWRHWAVTEHARGDYVGFTNDDNYYSPVWLEWLISDLIAHKADFAYCDMIHSHLKWRLLKTRPAYRHLDLGGFVARTGLIKSTPWKDFSFRGDGAYINALVKKAKRVVKVSAALFVHN